jgi:hypothetical protein
MVLSFDIEWTIGVKYRKKPFNLNKKITIQFKNNPPKNRKETIQLLK